MLNKKIKSKVVLLLLTAFICITITACNKKYEVDIVVMGGDWAGSDRFEYLKDYCQVV
ncbi:hypothetical protein P0G10_20360 [Eubacteriales bacterium DFI.9.88]|nr:hypothetical protein [Eubacteriales bacterium DFI.9.88]